MSLTPRRHHMDSDNLTAPVNNTNVEAASATAEPNRADSDTSRGQIGSIVYFASVFGVETPRWTISRVFPSGNADNTYPEDEELRRDYGLPPAVADAPLSVANQVRGEVQCDARKMREQLLFCVLIP